MKEDYMSAWAIPGIKECDRTNLLDPKAKYDRIIEKVCDYYRVKVVKVKSQSRERKLTLARQFSMHFLKSNTKLSLKDIGLMFDHRHHSTVIHSLREIKKELSIPVETPVKKDYAQLIRII